MNNFQQLEANYLFQSLLKSLSKLPIAKIILFLVPYFSLLLVLFLFFYVLRKLLGLKLYLDEKQILLELTPPSFTEQKTYATDQLFAIIHELGTQRTFKDRLFGIKPRYVETILREKVDEKGSGWTKSGYANFHLSVF